MTKQRRTVKAKPTRKQLLDAISTCQSLFGAVEAAYLNDRARDRADRVIKLTKAGFELCLEMRRFDPP